VTKSKSRGSSERAGPLDRHRRHAEVATGDADARRDHAAAVAATVLVLSVFALNRVEFTGVLGSFPGDGLLATLLLAGVGGVTLVSASVSVPV
jgi:hypothetical protein